MKRSPQDTYLTIEQVRRIDRIAVEQYAIPSIVLMENAARSALATISTFYPPEEFPRVAILVGAGNNGGDGLALARLMHNAGYHVRILMAVALEKLDGEAAINRDIAMSMKLPLEQLRDGDELDIDVARSVFQQSDLAVDALLGTGIKGRARPPIADLIEELNMQPDLPAVALDVPSGFDANIGMPADLGEGSAIIAALTVTFAANKVGYREPGASAYTGRVVVGTIGAPIEILEEVARD
jgi:NAD(P)H-hydrate epimerase